MKPMHEEAAAYLGKRLELAKRALCRAKLRSGVTETEIDNLKRKITVIEWMLENVANDRKQETQGHQMASKDHRERSGRTLNESAAERNVILKTSAETKEALQTCKIAIKGSFVANCNKKCPYYEVEEFCRNRLHDDALSYIETLESTYSQVSKALCGKENATLDELLQAVDQLKKERTWHKPDDNDFPEDHKPVLIAYKGIDFVTAGYWHDGFAEWDGLDGMEITGPDYWQEMPEAPKE